MWVKIVLCVISVAIIYLIYPHFMSHEHLLSEHELGVVIHNEMGYIKHEDLQPHQTKSAIKNISESEIKVSRKKTLYNIKHPKKINSFGNKIIDFSGFSNGGDGDGNLGVWLPIGDGINSSGIESSIIYISNWNNNQLISCNVNKDYYDPAISGGTNGSGVTPTGLYSCKTINNLNLNSPENMVVNNNNLYIVNGPYLQQSFITTCRLDNHGVIYNCLNYNLPVASAAYINFNSITQILISAFPTKGFSSITSCEANNSGYVVLCSNATTINQALIPQLIVGGFQYKTDYNNNAIDKCVGVACQLITNPLFIGPIGVFVSQNTAYITNSNNTVIGCGVDQSTGWFFNCTTLASGLNSPAGITQFTMNSN